MFIHMQMTKEKQNLLLFTFEKKWTKHVLNVSSSFIGKIFDGFASISQHSGQKLYLVLSSFSMRVDNVFSICPMQANCIELLKLRSNTNSLIRNHVERESTEVRITQKCKKKEELLTEKMNRSQDERHTSTQESFVN